MASADLNLSPKKRRVIPADDDTLTTPKRLRVAKYVTPSSSKSIPKDKTEIVLPAHLARLYAIHSSLQHALSVALATSAVSPCTDTGRVPNVLTNFSLTTSMGFTHNCHADDLKRLCWLWEWNGESLTSTDKQKRVRKGIVDDDEDNPFVVAEPSSDWTRGGMGLIVSSSTQLVRTEGKRVPAYGIGIEVDIDLAEGKTGGMAAVARWTAEGELRRKQLERKLLAWANLHNSMSPVPNVPIADLPVLPATIKVSPLTAKLLANSSSPSVSPNKASTPNSMSKGPSPNKGFAVPFPVTPQTPFGSPSKSSRLNPLGKPSPRTPSNSARDGSASITNTPTTARRAALYERIRQKSLTSGSEPGASSFSPNKDSVTSTPNSCVSEKDKFRQLGQEGARRRLLVSRLEQVAATVWALFSSPVQTASTPLSVARKRRTMPMDEVIRAMIASSTTPISTADAHDSLTLLMELCPFFLKSLVISGEEWVEMPSSTPASISTPPSPRSKNDSEQEVLHRSPKSVKMERGGLREVRERIRREQELCEY